MAAVRVGFAPRWSILFAPYLSILVVYSAWCVSYHGHSCTSAEPRDQLGPAHSRVSRRGRPCDTVVKAHDRSVVDLMFFGVTCGQLGVYLSSTRKPRWQEKTLVVRLYAQWDGQVPHVLSVGMGVDRWLHHDRLRDVLYLGLLCRQVWRIFSVLHPQESVLPQRDLIRIHCSADPVRCCAISYIRRTDHLTRTGELSAPLVDRC